MSDEDPFGSAGSPGSQLGKSGVGGGGTGPDIPPIQPQHDPGDTQPLPNEEKLNHREYIPAVWKPAGMGGGSPKISGGVEIDKRTGTTAPRGLNRAGQRYELTGTDLQTRRRATAAAEYSTTVVLVGYANQFEVRSPSGNNYDVAETLVTCDCPDYFKQDMSGYGILRCKHIYIVIQALSDPIYPNGLPWSTAKWAFDVGCSERTAQELCQAGFIPASKAHDVWVIDPLVGADTSALYKLNIWPFG